MRTRFVVFTDTLWSHHILTSITTASRGQRHHPQLWSTSSSHVRTLFWTHECTCCWIADNTLVFPSLLVSPSFSNKRSILGQRQVFGTGSNFVRHTGQQVRGIQSCRTSARLQGPGADVPALCIWVPHAAEISRHSNDQRLSSSSSTVSCRTPMWVMTGPHQGASATLFSSQSTRRTKIRIRLKSWSTQSKSNSNDRCAWRLHSKRLFRLSAD